MLFIYNHARKYKKTFQKRVERTVGSPMNFWCRHADC